MSTKVPELSFKDIEKGDSFSINILKEALAAHGFFSITDHGLSQDLIDKCYRCSKDFFDLNYETKNVDLYKKDTTHEIYGAMGYLTEISLQKNRGEGNHLLKPKMLVRYSPGNMRKELEGSRLSPESAFTLNRVDNINNFEAMQTAYRVTMNLNTNEDGDPGPEGVHQDSCVVTAISLINRKFHYEKK